MTPAVIYVATVASGATSSAEIALRAGYQTCFLAIQSMTSNSQLHLQAAATSGGTYRRVTHPPINSSTVALNDFTVLSSVTNRIVPIPAGLHFIKIEQTATADSGQSYTLICG